MNRLGLGSDGAIYREHLRIVIISSRVKVPCSAKSFRFLLVPETPRPPRKRERASPRRANLSSSEEYPDHAKKKKKVNNFCLTEFVRVQEGFRVTYAARRKHETILHYNTTQCLCSAHAIASINALTISASAHRELPKVMPSICSLALINF